MKFFLSYFFLLSLNFVDFWYMFSGGVNFLFWNYEIRLAWVRLQCLLRQTLAKKNLPEPIKLINYFLPHISSDFEIYLC